MPRPLPLKLAFVAAILLVVTHAAASSHAHDGDHADEACLVCVASADFAPAALVPEPVRSLAPAQREAEGRIAAPYHARPAAYSARAPPSS